MAFSLFCSGIDCIPRLCVAQGPFRFRSCFSFNALPIPVNLRPLENEAAATDDPAVKGAEEKGHKSQDISFKPVSSGHPSVCQD